MYPAVPMELVFATLQAGMLLAWALLISRLAPPARLLLLGQVFLCGAGLAVHAAPGAAGALLLTAFAWTTGLNMLPRRSTLLLAGAAATAAGAAAFLAWFAAPAARQLALLPAGVAILLLAGRASRPAGCFPGRPPGFTVICLCIAGCCATIAAFVPGTTMQWLLPIVGSGLLIGQAGLLPALLIPDRHGSPRIALPGNEGHYAAVFDELPVAAFLCHGDGRFATANRCLRELLHLDAVAERDWSLFHFLAHEDREEMQAILDRLAVNQIESTDRSFWFNTGSGNTVLAETLLVHFLPGSGLLVGIVRDISSTMMKNKQMLDYASSLEKRLTERNRELSAKNRELAARNRELLANKKSRNVFFANVSHELRTPLVAVCGYIEMLLEGKLGPVPQAMADAFATVNRNLSRLTSFIDNLLDLARVDAFRDRVKREPVSPAEAVVGIRDEFGIQARQRNLVLIMEVPEDLPAVMVDRRHLEQILYNLVANAVKFTERGSIRIQARRGGKDMIEFCVRDTGPGISDKDKQFIFDRFYQIERQGGGEPGSGLGLAIVRELVENYGGRVRVGDNPGGGAVFSFSLSCDRSNAVRPRLHRRILSVSANPQQNTRIRQYFVMEGFGVYCATTGLEALEYLEARAYDLVFTDPVLPDLEAAELCKLLRRRSSEAPPVYVTTFPLNERERNALFLAGAKGLITKPFNAQALKRVFEQEFPAADAQQ